MEAVSLQQLIKDTAWELRQIYEGITTLSGAGTAAFVDSAFATSGAAAYLDDEWVGTQVVFEEPAYTAGGNINPGVHVINDFTSTSGTFVSGLPFRSAGNVAAGLPYFLIRPRGQGVPYQGYLAAIRYALDALNVKTTGKNATLTTAAETYDYTIPSGLGWVYDVTLTKPGYTELSLPPNLWNLRPGRGLNLNYAVNVALGWTLNLFGYTEDALPATLDGTVVCDRDRVIQLASERLQANSGSAGDNARADRKQQERLRFGRMQLAANTRRVLP